MTVDICFHSAWEENKALCLISYTEKFQDFGGGKENRYYYWVYTVDDDQVKILKENGIEYVEWVY